MESLPDRFTSKVLVSGKCWLWIGAVKQDGYGSYRANGKTTSAHRYSYQTLRGPIPQGLELDHLCRIRNCVNPEHLEPVTHKENMSRSPILLERFMRHNRYKEACMRGHEFTEENTYWWRGQRTCRTCHKLRQQKGWTG